jgi:uncharacterized protein
VTVLDANILLYAYNSDAGQSAVTSRWLSGVIATGETIGIPWITIWAFIRISTDPRIWRRPKRVTEVFEIVRSWAVHPSIVMLNPGSRYVDILQELMSNHNAVGGLAMDAALAAIAIEHGAALASADRDFGRFKGLRWINPLE